MQGDRMMKVLLAFVGTGLWAVALRGGLAARPAGDPVAQVLRARRIEVVDANGKARAVLGVDNGGPMVDLEDSNGRTRLRMAVDKLATGIRLNDAAGMVRLAQAVLSDGTPNVWLSDAAGKTRLQQMVLSDGTPDVLLYDAAGETRAILGVATLVTTATGAQETTAPSSLVLFDKDGKVLRRLP